MHRLSFLLLTLFFISIADVNAQRRATYESLLQRSDQPSAYVGNLYLPVNDSTAIFGAFFRLDYDFLPFLRKRPNVTPPSSEMEYYAPVRMGVEIFEGNIPGSRRARQNAVSLFRDSFRDTLWVAEFEETTSRLEHAQGLVQTELTSGNYHYELQLSRGESVRELPSRRWNITIPDFSNFDSAGITLLNNLEVSGNQLSANLLNYGDNVLYGQDYSLLILLPVNTDNLKLSVYQMQPGSETEARENALFEAPVSSENTFSGSSGNLARSNEDIELSIAVDESGEETYRYAYITVPNKDFENARYKLVLGRDGSQEPVAERIVNSQWLDMPVSLYNLDVAISMMRFIVDDQELRRISSGSTSDKERKFREFWAERDPTPDTEFNELMDEYYSRIDYSYQNFSSMQTPGYETDQGRAYILYGPPQNVERRFPTNSPTREIWEYGSRTLIFEATSGFGDFRLVSES
ncbi:MAG: GWxTD domain-containing protein [Balneolaceae bacterium]